MKTQLPRLNSEKILKDCPTFFHHIEIVESIDSTNTRCKQEATLHNEGYLLVAESQTSGRGRWNRVFNSPAYTGLYVSLLLKPKDSSTILNKLSLITPCAMAKAIVELTQLKVQIKWPNDLWFNEKKLAGILIESSFKPNSDILEYVVIGIGVNVHQQDFPTELKDVAASIENFTEYPCDRNLLLNAFLKHFYILLNQSAIIDDYKTFMMPKGSPIKVISTQEHYHALIEDIDNQGHLIIKKEDNTLVTLISEEIRIQPL